MSRLKDSLVTPDSRFVWIATHGIASKCRTHSHNVRVWKLASASAQQQDLHGSEENVNVETDGDVLNVEEIVGQLLRVVLNGGVVTTIDLRPTRSTWFDQPALFIEWNDRRALF